MSTQIARKVGRPPYVPTPTDREAVGLLRANGVEIAIIAKVLRISLATINRHYAAELRDAHAVATAKVGAVLLKAALSGNINAATRWLIMKGGWHYAKGQGLGDIVPDGPSEVVHFYLPPNRRDEPEPPITIDGEALPPSPAQMPQALPPAPQRSTPAVPARSSWSRIARG